MMGRISQIYKGNIFLHVFSTDFVEKLMAIFNIRDVAIVDPCNCYGYPKNRLDLRIEASEADFAKIMNLRVRNKKYIRKCFSFMNYGYTLYILSRNYALEEALPIISQT